MTQPALASETEVRPETATLADCSPHEQLEQRYLAALNALVDDAAANQSFETLVDTLAWTLAKIMVGFGTTAVTGDALGRLGKYVCELTERREAQAEAEKAKKQGLRPH